MVPFCWKEKCFLCAKKAVHDAKNPNRIVIHHVTTIELRRKVIEQCNIRNDDWGNNVYTRLSCSNDLVADEGIHSRSPDLSGSLPLFNLISRSPAFV